MLPNGRVRLTLPMTPAKRMLVPPDGLRTALGLPPTTFVECAESSNYLLVAVRSVAEVEAVRVDYAALSKLIAPPKFGTIVTAVVEPARPVLSADFVSRVFFPDELTEDPVCAGAHQVLASHWHAKQGKQSLIGYQASRRGGFVGIEVLNSTHISLSTRFA